MRRSGRLARWLARLAPGFAWRWGLKNAYGWEQWSFWLKLRRELRRGAYDILHVQDPMLAYWCKRDRERGYLKTQEVLAHGTEESPAFRAAFPCLQELAPWHLDALYRARGTAPADRPLWTVMPNFVDTASFRPCRDDAERRAVRCEWNIPEDAFVVGCVAALKREHKRLDALISECARVLRDSAPTGPGQRLFLFAAGAATPDTPLLQAQAARELGARACLLPDVARDRMPSLYRCMDVFVMPSLFEMMPIAVLEAMASGVPVIANRHPVLEWMVGVEGEGIDLGPWTLDHRPVEEGERDLGLPSVALAKEGPWTLDHRPVGEDSWQLAVGSRQEAQMEEGRPPTAGGEAYRPVEGEGRDLGLPSVALAKEGPWTLDHRPVGEGEGRIDLGPWTLDHRPVEEQDLRADVPRSNVQGLRSKVYSAAGCCIDMGTDGALAECLSGLSQEWVRETGAVARGRAMALFSKEAVVGRYVEYYGRVLRQVD